MIRRLHRSPSQLLSLVAIFAIVAAAVFNLIPSGKITALPNLTQLPPTLTKYFDGITFPATDIIHAGQISVLRFDLGNPNTANTDSFVNVKFTDQLPPNVYFNSLTPTLNTCTGAGISIVATNSGSTGFLDVNHVDIPFNSSCQITFDVTTTVPGNYTNTTNPINADNAPNSQNVGKATLSVINTLQQPVINKSFNNSTVPPGGTSTLTITIQNPNPAPTAGQPVTLNDYVKVNFTDDFTSTGIVMTGVVNATNCGVGSVAAQGSAVIKMTNGTIPQGTTCTISVQVKAPNGISQQTNTILAHSVTYNGGDNPTDVPAKLTVFAAPSISKTFGTFASPVTSFVTGNTTTLQFNVTNPAANGITFTNVTMTDTLPGSMVIDATPGLTFSPANCLTATAVAGSNQIQITGGTLGVGASCLFTVNVTDNTTELGLKNTSGPVKGDYNGTTVTGNTASANVDVTPVLIPPATVTKSFSPTSIVNGGTTTMTIQITNPNATKALTNVDLSDTLPSGLVFTYPANPVVSGTCGTTHTVSVTPAYSGQGQGTLAQTGLAFHTSDLPGGAVCTITVSVTGVTVGGPYTNTTSPVTAFNSLPGTPASADLTTVSNGTPGDSNPLQLTKSFTPATINAGQTTTLEIDIKNPDTFPQFGVTLIDNLPTTGSGAPGNMVVANVPSRIALNDCGLDVTAAVDTSIVKVTGGVIPANTTCHLQIIVTAPATGTYNNTTGPASSQNIPQNSNTPTASLTVNGSASVKPATLDKAFPGQTAGTSIAVGDTTPLTITVTNPNKQGTGAEATLFDLVNIQFTDPMPAEIKAVGKTGGTCVTTYGGSASFAAGSVSGTVNLPANATGDNSCTFTYTVQGIKGGVAHNTIPKSTSNNGGDGPASPTRDLNVEAPPIISKTFITSGGGAIAGQTATLQITITNPGANPFPITGVGLTDSLPALSADPLTQMVVVGGSLLTNGNCGPATWTSSTPVNNGLITGDTLLTLTNATITVGTPCVLSATVNTPKKKK